MKTPEEWIENLKDHPDCQFINPQAVTLDFIEAIQRDALNSPFVNTTEQQELELAGDVIENLKFQIEVLTDDVERYKNKWHEARRYLRAANKGAQRNAEALELCQNRYWEMISSDKRWKERDINNHKTIVWNWLMMSDEDFRRKFGDPITNEHIYAFRILLKAMLGTSLLKHL